MTSWKPPWRGAAVVTFSNNPETPRWRKIWQPLKRYIVFDIHHYSWRATIIAPYRARGNREVFRTYASHRLVQAPRCFWRSSRNAESAVVIFRDEMEFHANFMVTKPTEMVILPPEIWFLAWNWGIETMKNDFGFMGLSKNGGYPFLKKKRYLPSGREAFFGLKSTWVPVSLAKRRLGMGCQRTVFIVIMVEYHTQPKITTYYIP